MSATIAIGWTLNPRRMSRVSGVKGGQYGGNRLILAHFLLLVHYTKCEAWLLACLLSRSSDGEGNLSDDKAELSRISQLSRRFPCQADSLSHDHTSRVTLASSWVSSTGTVTFFD